MTTHRPIASIEINGFEPGGTPRALPIFEWVKPETLLIDATYQRDLSERSLKLIRRIVAGWDWAKFKSPVGVLTVAGVELIDGQCTAIAAATHPDVDTIPVMIVDVQELSERADAFIGHNRDRVAVTAAQLHVAAVAAGDVVANQVNAVAEAAGVTILRQQPGSGRWKPAQTISVTAMGSLISSRGKEAATKVMACLAKSELAPINQTHIRAVDLLLSDPEYRDQITADRLTATINGMGRKAESEAAVFRAAHPSTPAWKALAIVWFKNRRVKAQTGTDGEPVSSLSQNLPSIAVSAAGKSSPAVSLISGKRDGRPKLNGWIPGPILLRCSGCDDKYQGDKRSRSCADCAYGCKEAVPA